MMLPLVRSHALIRCTACTAARVSRRPTLATKMLCSTSATSSLSPPPSKASDLHVPKTAEKQEVSANAGGDDDVHIPKHLVLYESGSKRLLRISSAATIVNGLFWSFYVGVLEQQLPATTWEPWGYLGVGCTTLMFVVSHQFAKHWVGNVSYFPEYTLLSISTHNFFGAERPPQLVKLGGTLLPKTKPSPVYVPFKVKGNMLYHLLDNDDGVFHDRDLLMRLLKATPGEDVVVTSSSDSEDGDAPANAKTKSAWKKRKRNR